MNRFIKKLNLNRAKIKDSGLIVILILLLVGIFSKNSLYFYLTIPAIILLLVIPIVYYPFSVFWFGLSEILGYLISKIIFSIIFFVIVTPTGLIRKMAGKDTLKLNLFKKDPGTAFITRNKTFSFKDIQKPF